LLYGADEARPADLPTPTYFIFPIWTQSGDEVLSVSGMTNPARILNAYASRCADGSAQVVIINKTGDSVPVRIAFNGYIPAGSVELYELRPARAGVTAEDVIYNGVLMPDVTAARLPPPSSIKIEGAEFVHSVPPYSLTLLNFRRPADATATSGVGQARTSSCVR
jgi:hypothetical protein